MLVGPCLGSGATRGPGSHLVRPAEDSGMWEAERGPLTRRQPPILQGPQEGTQGWYV